MSSAAKHTMAQIEQSAAVTLEREGQSTHPSAAAPSTVRPKTGAMWARAARLLFLILIASVLVASIIDDAYSWRTRRVLAGAARAAAKVTISTPLNAKNCQGTTPCSIESGASAAKLYLLNAGFAQANCINPKDPSFSGVLVWAFSCRGGPPAATAADACDTNDAVVCVKIDMTPTVIQKNGALVGYTRATVQYPHRWLTASILRFLPEKLTPHFPKSVAGSTLLPD